jgi:Ca2+-binding RTX toxin-like protein
MPTLTGNWWDDTIHADPGNNVESDPEFLIYGYHGNDHLYGAANDDFIDGGTGADFMFGDRGDDTYVVDHVDDVVREIDHRFSFFAGDHDLIYTSITLTLPEFVEDLSLLTGAGAINGTGNELENIIHGNESGNTLQGFDGEDLIIGHDGNDTLQGGNQNDELYGGNQNDTLEGGDGQDRLYGGNHSDTLEGGANNDTLDGGTGADDMRGGTGSDTYFVDNVGDQVTDNGILGTDTVYSTVSFTLGDNVEDLGLMGTGEIDGTGNELDNTIAGNGSDNELRGLDGEDFLKGGGGADTLRGGNQNDELYGEAGDDLLRGDAGDDEMYGGTGDDDYFVNSAGDFVDEDPGEGRDTVFASVVDDYTLTANVEDLVLVTSDNGTGNASNNTITGNLLDNTIDGAGGADTMEGRQGDDTYLVDQSNDIVREFAGQGNDTVRTSINYTLSTGVEVETLRTTDDTGTAALELTGNEFNNTLIGNDGGNILRGRGGSDGIDGRGGIDTVNYFDSSGGAIVVLGQNGAPGFAYEFGLVNNQAVLVSVDTLLNIENVLGSGQNDTLVGNEVINRLQGFAGNDTYVVQNAGDTIMEGAGQGSDEVRTSVSYTLAAVNADIETLRTTDDNGTAPINLTGNGVNNHLIGNNAGNTLDGGGGNNDELEGRDGDDTYLVNNANVRITENGGLGIDTVRASLTYTLTAGADVELLATNNDAGTAAINLTGNANGNEVRGNNGNNVLNGGDGRDFLTGLGGQDQFLFNTALNAASNVDEIADFTLGVDTIQLENTIFNVFAAGGLAAERFFLIGTGVQDGNDNILYDQATGALFYDSDAAGGAAPILFAQVTPDLDLSAADFFVV